MHKSFALSLALVCSAERAPWKDGDLDVDTSLMQHNTLEVESEEDDLLDEDVDYYEYELDEDATPAELEADELLAGKGKGGGGKGKKGKTSPTPVPTWGPTIPGQVYPDPYPPCKDHINELMLEIDASGSITQAGWDASAITAREVVRRVKPSANGTRIGIIIFTSSLPKILPLTDDANVLLSTINNYVFNGGGTGTHLALAEARTQLSNVRAGARKVSVMITDGQPNDAAQTNAQAAAIKADGVKSVWVLVGSGAPIAQGQQWATTPADAFTLSNFATLDEKLVDTLMPPMCGALGR